MASRFAPGIAEQVRNQRRWIEEHGGSLAGYRRIYGSDAAAVFEADRERLRILQDRLTRTGQHRNRPAHPHSRAERKSIETRLTRRSGRRRYRSR